MDNSGWNMYVFRDGRRSVCGQSLVSALAEALGQLHLAAQGKENHEDRILAALVAAGELECALADSNASDATRNLSLDRAARISNAIGTMLVSGELAGAEEFETLARTIEAPPRVSIAVQEGFAYYALHPTKLVMLIDGLKLQRRVAVIGLRSIGVPLSAVAKAALSHSQHESDRITVRPNGHPYERKLELDAETSRWIEDWRDADFLIVDEGPGISGSSFLAVADALAQAGVNPSCIHMIGSRQADPSTLRAPQAAERWARYHFHCMQIAPLVPDAAGEGIAGGIWRRHFLDPSMYGDDVHPASWTQLEPAKFLSKDGKSLLKFEGFGHFGEEISRRARLLEQNGYGPVYDGAQRGFGSYRLMQGRLLKADDLSPALLERIANYLAFRSREFVSELPQNPDLGTMLRWNWKVEFDEDLSEDESRLVAQRVVICDARMMPHEWFETVDRRYVKLDSSTHGDDHFFPGPCDIAWDLAGTIVEWNLDESASEKLIGRYEALTGDRVRARLHPYLLAYSAFRMGWSKMAALAMDGEFDQHLLERDYRRYRNSALRFCAAEKYLTQAISAD